MDQLDKEHQFVDADLACIGCGYNIRTLEHDRRCPECSMPVAHSLRSNIITTDVTWLRSARSGTSELLLAYSCFLIAFTLGLLTAYAYDFVLVLLAGAAALTGLLAALIGIIHVTRPIQSNTFPVTATWARRCARVVITFPFAAIPPAIVQPGLEGVPLFMVPVCLAGGTALALVYLHFVLKKSASAGRDQFGGNEKSEFLSIIIAVGVTVSCIVFGYAARSPSTKGIRGMMGFLMYIAVPTAAIFVIIVAARYRAIMTTAIKAVGDGETEAAGPGH